MPKKKSQKKKSKSRSKSKKSRLVPSLIAIIILLILTQFGVTFIPRSAIPSEVRPFHSMLLKLRNKGMSSAGMATYDAEATIESGDKDIRIFFAPSPSIAQHLADFISEAKSTVDVCVYDLDLKVVIESLIKAHKGGVKVRVITDTDNYDLKELDALKQAGVEIKNDMGRGAIMHNKFVVIDKAKTWMGSFNFTRNGANKNDNNALIIESKYLADNYTNEFEEMWDGQFGARSPRNTEYPGIKLDGIVLENYFAPEDGVMAQVLQEVGKAEKTIDILAFSFTSQDLVQAIAGKIKKGVVVICLFDARQAEGKYSADERVAELGAKVRISQNHVGHLHHKVIIIDSKTVITGSFNFSKNADKSNDENILVIHSEDIAKVFDEEFYRCWENLKGY